MDTVSTRGSSGRVLVTVSEAKKMARLKVELVGQGQVRDLA